MLMSLLEVTIQMSEAIEVISSIGEAVATISDAMLCVDETMKLITDSLSLTQAANYGFWARRRAKRNIRRTIDNNIGRMKQMTMMLSGSMEIADMLTESMQQMSVGQQKMMAKRAKKQEKLQQKRQKNGTTSFVANPNAKRRIDEMRASRAAGDGAETGGGSTGGGQGFMGGGIGVDEMRGLISETVTALLPGVQQALPQQASTNDELVNKLIEKNEKLMEKLERQSVEKVVEREVAVSGVDEEVIKQIIDKNDERIETLMQKI